MQNKPPTTQSHSHHSIKKIFIRVVLIFIIIVLLLLSYVSGFIPFTFGVVKCFGLPAETSDFMADSSYSVPGDEDYGIHPLLSSYTYCSGKDAEAHGYHHSVLTSAGWSEQEALWKKHQEENTFSPDKIDYTLYVPNKAYTISNLHVNQMTTRQSGLDAPQNHTFYDVSKNGKRIGQVRELKKGDVYNLCQSNDDPSKKYCKVVGTDNQGQEIHREYVKDFKNNWQSYYVEDVIGDTGIILATNDDGAAIAFFDSLTQYTGK